MQAADPCVECGGTALKLIDGFYYCIECNTQNTNVRETVVEQKTLGDGTFATTTRRKIVKVHDSKIQMSREWYKWHAYNFIILGLADELVAAGAKPTFKLKLLWIWTRYIKKYQNKNALGLATTVEEGNNENVTLPGFLFVEENSSSHPVPDEEDDELENEETAKKTKNKNAIMDGSRRDIKFLSKGVIIAMLYLALNLDESDIQLYHILRFIKEKHLNFSNIQRFLPEDIHVKSIQDEWMKFVHSKVCNIHRIRALAMSLLRKLDLGTPKVPNMRKMIDDFLLELCLPNDIKPMIYSLMFFHHCDFLDMSNRSKDHLVQMPDYEGVGMSYVLVALKMCFGLDGDYEEKLSDTVAKINDEQDLPKSYKMGKYSEPSTRLISFREWCSYMQFRKITLCKSSLHMAEQHCLDIDDYVYLEHMSNRPQNNRDLQDETAMNLISKIPEDDEARVIPKHMFSPTLTPMTDYTEIIIEHTQDHEMIALLSEDFTQYSLNYACEHLELVDTNSGNIIKGVSEDRKIVGKVILGTIVTKKSKSEMVYVKNCENRNWMITNPPTMEHVTCEDEQNVSNDKESDHGYGSENPSIEKEVCTETENIGDTDQIMKEVNQLVNPVNEKEVCIDTENIGTDQSTKEIIESENPTNEKEIPIETEIISITDQIMKEVDESENPTNEKEVSKETENISITHQSMKEVNESEKPANEKEVSTAAENIDDPDQSMKEVNESENLTANIDDTDQSMIEVDDSENLANEKSVCTETENKDITDHSMKVDNRKLNDSENIENEYDVSEINKNITDITNHSLKNGREFIITEEDNDKNIFDDSFEELDLKDEIEQNNVEDLYTDNGDQPLQHNVSLYDDRASISDASDIHYPPFNPDAFDREQTIKELILHACKKYKIAIPREYREPREPRKRKAATFCNEETLKERRKRAKMNREASRTKIEELISSYYSLKESDFLSKMQEAASLAIRNTQLHSVLNVSQNETGNISFPSSIINGNVENQTNTIPQNLSNTNPQISLLGHTDKEQNLDEADNIDEIDENWESKLFEGEEEMKLDDLVPKGDPKFDEEKYDVNQLFMKIKVQDEEDLYNLQDNPKLEQIIKQKIEECKNSTEFEKLKAKPIPAVKTKYESDSEDDIPLNVLQKEKKMIEEKNSWEDNFEPLINRDKVTEFKYWFRHYDTDFMTRSTDWHKKFDEELKVNTPSSFYFVIRECASILNCSTFTLYKHMQNLEKYIRAQAKYSD